MTNEEVTNLLNRHISSRVKNITAPMEGRMYCEADKDDILEISKILFHKLHARFDIASGMQMANDFEILYHWAFEGGPGSVILSIRVHLPLDKPVVDSLTPEILAAHWIEREMTELLGIQFNHHPDMRHLLLAEDWPDGVYPLRRGEPWVGKVEKKL